jgi:hypothetical protein
MKTTNKFNFYLDTDWIFQGVIDYEQKQYVLLDFFQKLNTSFEEMKLYPMFIELALHLGNVQTLNNQNKMLFTNKKFTSNDDELLLSDLKMIDIPVLANEEVSEYKKILKQSQEQLHNYFDFAKSLWTIVYDSIEMTVKMNKRKLDSKTGVFYYETENKLYIWEYKIKKVYKVKNQYRTHLKSIYDGEITPVNEVISKHYNLDGLNNKFHYPIFEMKCSNIFPIKETLLPIFKRKIMAHINQPNLKEKKTYKLNS